MTAIRSARPVTTSMWCSTINTVRPSSWWTARITSTSSGTSSMDTPAIGSSRRSTWGPEASSIASSSLRLSPCESAAAGTRSRAPRPTRSSAQRAFSRAARPREASRQIRRLPPLPASAARRTFSSAWSAGNPLEARKGRPSPGRVRVCGAAPVTSRPASSTVPEVGLSTPVRRLKSDVLPAPFGPMMPRHSPAATSSETSATIVAPPMSSPRPRVARMGERVTCRPARLLLLHQRRHHVAGRDALENDRHEAGPLRLQLDLKHRLEQSVILRPDIFRALRPDELPALERRDHLVDVLVAVRRLERVHDHLRRDEPVRREQVGGLVALLHLGHEPVVDLVLRSSPDVVREEVDVGRNRAERRPRRLLRQARDDLRVAAEDALLLQRLPHRRGGRPGPRDEDQVRARVLRLLRERGEVVRRQRDGDLRDLVALAAEER